MDNERKAGEVAYKVCVVDEHGDELFEYQAFMPKIVEPYSLNALMIDAQVKLFTMIELLSLDDESSN